MELVHFCGNSVIQRYLFSADGEYKDCRDLHNPDHGYCKISGHTATYSCNDDYEVYGGDRVRTCLDGIWDGKEPYCRKKGKLKHIIRLPVRNFTNTLTRTSIDYDNKHCGHPKDPEYGYCKVSGTGYGSTATYHCNNGYEVYGGDRVRTCHDGIWGGKEPQCRKIGKLKNLTSCEQLHAHNEMNTCRVQQQGLWTSKRSKIWLL